MSARRRALLREAPAEPISLLPFLSIFLCVMGVLSFLNLVGSTMAPSRVLLTGGLTHAGKTAYKVLCLPDGMVPIPPLAALARIAAAGDDAELADLLRRRTEALEALRAADPAASARAPVEDEVMPLLHEIDRVNQQARATGRPYEEFLLFGIYPGGGATYHAIRDLLLEHPKIGIGVGLEPLEPNWRPALESG